MAEKKTGKREIDDPVLAELEKKKAAALARINAEIKERKRAVASQSRKDENRIKVLIGVAYLADAELHPEKRQNIVAILDRGITDKRNRGFLKEQGWLD